MLTVAVIGLGAFGSSVVEEMIKENVELIIVDKDRTLVEKYKDNVREAYITDIMNISILAQIIPENVSAVIIDLGSYVEASILTTNHLHKIGIKEIIVKAKNKEHGEILKLVGATKVVFPDYDAAQRLTPIVLSSVMFDFVQISSTFALAEVGIKPEMLGKTLSDLKFRENFRLNVIASRASADDEFLSVESADFILKEGMRLLVSGNIADIDKYLVTRREDKKKSLKELFEIHKKRGKKG